MSSNFLSYLKLGRVVHWYTIVCQCLSYSIHRIKNSIFSKNEDEASFEEDFAHILRPKTRIELIRISAAVTGIEFCYAAETAFVSPTILKIGVSHSHMSLIWCLSPLIGFFLTPVLGSLSDNCSSRFGRRRPFICCLSLGIILGLIFVPNGREFGMAMGDTALQGNQTDINTGAISSQSTQMKFPEKFQDDSIINSTTVYNSLDNINATMLTQIEKFTANDNSHPWGIFFTILGTVLLDFDADACQSPSRAYLLDITLSEDHAIGLSTFTIMAGLGGSLGYIMGAVNWDATSFGKKLGGQVHAVFTIIAFIYLICVSITVFSFREIPLHLLEKRNFYLNEKNISQIVGSKKLQRRKSNSPFSLLPTYHYKKFVDEEDEATTANQKVDINRKQSDQFDYDDNNGEGDINQRPYLQNGGEDRAKCNENWHYRYLKTYGSLHTNDYPVLMQKSNSNEATSTSCTDLKLSCISPVQVSENKSKDESLEVNVGQEENIGSPTTIAIYDNDPCLPDQTSSEVQLKHYLSSIFRIPISLRILCLTNLFSWMSLVSYSLYFTDFVGEAVYDGNPLAVEGSLDRLQYENGVRFGCLGMALYSLSCSLYSLVIDKLIQTFGGRSVYVGGHMIYSFGMMMLALSRHRASVIILSASAGVMYATLFTMPYLLIAHYHSNNVFDVPTRIHIQNRSQIRGLGTDIAIVSSMVFLAQFTLSLCMGPLVHLFNSTVTIVVMAAVLSFCGGICASQTSVVGSGLQPRMFPSYGN